MFRGWRVYHDRDPNRWPIGRLMAFIGSLAAIYLALASPIEPFSSLLLSVHMVQHLLLMMVAPPLFWLATPLLPFVRGLPESVRTSWISPAISVGMAAEDALDSAAQPVAALGPVHYRDMELAFTGVV